MATNINIYIYIYIYRNILLYSSKIDKYFRQKL